MRRKLIDLKQQRSTLLESAEAMLKEGKREEYRAEMEKVTNMNADIKDLEDLVRELDRKFMEKAPDPAEEKDKAEERGNKLMKGLEVKFSPLEVAKALFIPKQVEKAVTLATGTLAQPTGAGSNIRDALGYGVGAIIDQVYVQDLTGMAAYLEPYVISEPDAKGAKVSTAAGTARAASSDPTFGVAKISPYELTTTSYVDRNIARLTPANYYAKVFNMAMRAMRRDTVKMIFNGDGQSTNDMFGIKTAKNIAGGEAVAIGMVQISRVAEKKNLMPQGITRQIAEMCVKFGLPVDYEPWRVEELYTALTHDKKARGNSIKTVIVPEIGKAAINQIPLVEMKEYLEK